MADRFTELLKRLVRVPKEEIDAEQRRMDDAKKSGGMRRMHAKPRGIVPALSGKKKTG